MLHPLLTKLPDGSLANSHYDKGKEPVIKQLEQQLTVIEMVGACKFNISKYIARDKGQDKSDTDKANKYLEYLVFLNKNIPTKYWFNETVKNAYDIIGIKLEYK